MTRLESDREDLMTEATALVQRAEFDMPGSTSSVIAGFRRDGALSIYFGGDPCYHFDPELRLRRAFVEGELYRTQGQTLARLRRTRTGQTVELRRNDLSNEERNAFCETAIDRLRQFRVVLNNRSRCRREVPAGADIQARLTGSLEQLLQHPIALAPAVRGKR